MKKMFLVLLPLIFLACEENVNVPETKIIETTKIVPDTIKCSAIEIISHGKKVIIGESIKFYNHNGDIVAEITPDENSIFIRSALQINIVAEECIQLDAPGNKLTFNGENILREEVPD